MAIKNVVQRGSKVYAYDEDGDELFNKAGELVRYTSDAVFVRRGNRVCKLDIYGYVVDGNVGGTTSMAWDEAMIADLFRFIFWIFRFAFRHSRITLVIVIILFGYLWVNDHFFSNPRQTQQEPVVSSEQTHQAQAVSFVKEYENRANIFHDAMELFTAQNYKQAKERFEWLAQIKYRPAFSSYMAGQCAYKEEHYQEAIKFYEQSLKIKEQATYTDILLENLANAYKALKDEKNYTHYKHLLDQQKTGGQ